MPTLPAVKTIELKDHVATTRITRYWAVPGLLDPRLAALDVGGSILGGLASSRLDQALVRDEKIAVGASAGMIPLQRAGIFTVSATVKPGVDPALVSRRLDAVVADFVAKGPSADEVQRAVMSEVSGQVRGLEQVGGGDGKASTLAEGQTYAGDSDFYKKALQSYAAVTPASVRQAMQQWLRRPPLTITLSPGERDAYAESTPVTVKPAPKDDGSLAKPTRSLPPVGQLTALAFPPITHTSLSNGIRVDYAQRDAVPITQVALAFDAGNAADAPDGRGLAAITMRLLGEATTTMGTQALAEAKERLGTDISTGNSADQSIVYLSALSPNLPASLDLLGDVVRNPAFAAPDIERVRVQSLTGISQLQKDPTRVAQRLLPSVLYGANHPYGGPAGGDPKAIARITRADLVAFQQRWLRPDNVTLFVVSDRPLAELKPLLDARFGAWAAPAGPRGNKSFTAPPPRPHAQKILLIDSPGSPQSTIVGGQLLPIDPKADIVPIDTANDVLGGDFLSRLNMDLREEKGWSYGVGGNENVSPNGVSYTVSAPVQADRTGDSLAELNAQLTAFLTTTGLTDEELTRTVAKNINQLPGEFETSQAVLGAMMDDALLGRPDNYYETLAARYRAQTRASADGAIRAAIDPQGFTWIVVGDAKTVRPQLEKLGLPIEVVTAP